MMHIYGPAILILNLIILNVAQADVQNIVTLFNRCLKNPTSSLDLQPRIRNILEEASNNPHDCVHLLPGTIDKSIIKVKSALDMLSFANAIKGQALHNTFLTFLETLTLQESKTLRPDHLVTSFCSYSSSDGCSSAEIAKYTELARSYLEFKSKNAELDDIALAESINNAIFGPKEKNKHIFFYSETLQKKIQKGQVITPMDVGDARTEVRNAIKTQVAKMRTLIRESDITTTKSDLKKLIKTHPVAFAQTLLRSGDFADYFIENSCQLIREIENEDAASKDGNLEKAFLWGGVIVGGVLLFSGSFSAVGVGVLKTVGTKVLIAGAAISLSEGVYLGQRSFQAYKDYDDLKGAILSKNSDEVALKERQEKWDQFSTLATKASLSTAFGVLDVGVFLAMFKSGAIDDALMTLHNILNDKKTYEAFINLGKNIGPDKMYSLLIYLLKAPVELSKFLIKVIVGGGTKEAPNLAIRILNFFKNYGKELFTSPYYSRLIFNKRDITQSRNFFKNPLPWFFNPLATARNSAHEFTIPAQIATTIALIDVPTNIINNNTANKNIAKAGTIAETFSGTDQIAKLAEEGYLSFEEALSSTLDYDRLLGEWLQSADNRMLPRLNELLRLKKITYDQALHINKLAKESYAEAENYRANNPEGDDVSDASELLAEKIRVTKELSQLSDQVKIEVGNYFVPLLKIQGKSELELLYLLLERKQNNQLTQLQLSSLDNIYSQLVANKVTLKNALTLAGATIDQQKSLYAKEEKAKKLFPSEMSSTFQRPDFVNLKFPMEFRKVDGTRIEINDEVDLWKILITDPIFGDLKKIRMENTAPDEAIIAELVVRINNLSEVNRILSDEKKIISDDSVDRLLYGNSEERLLPSPFFGSFSVLIRDAQKNLSIYEIALCKRNLIETIMPFLKKEQEDKYQNNFQEQNFLENYKIAINKTLRENCPFALQQ